MKPETASAEHNPEHAQLSVIDPEKWQMPIRLYLERRTIAEAEVWMAKYRMVSQMASQVIRDRVYNRNAEYCIVCNNLIRDGKPAGTHGYYDAVKSWVPVSYCNQAEYADALKYCMRKEEEVEREELRANEAARKALIDIRQGMRK